jgi:N-acetylneuraminic acid mutarotase
MPTPRNHIGAAFVGGKLFVAGGRNANSFTLDVLEAYDPVTQQWQTLRPMPTGRSGHAVAALRGCVYAIGGEGSNRPKGTFAENERYDPRANTWETAAPMPVAKHGIGAVEFGGRIFVPAGADLAGFGAVQTNESFTSARRCE